jgi:serine protease Do
MRARLVLLLLFLTPLALPAQRARRVEPDEPRSATASVFSRYASRILKVQVVETGSAAKVGTGTAFFVGADGRMVTNYHVIADWVHEPANHRVEVVPVDGEPVRATVLLVDVIADLAILDTDLATPDHFTLGATRLRQGDRLYSLGHPSDLGLSIVEGTYNGLLRHTLYPQIHFTGSINPGMSGGPAITASGRVVGVNVATMGDQRSFLVPQDRASTLLARTRAEGFVPPADFLALVGEQLREFQSGVLDGMFEDEVPSVDIGRFRVATQPSPVFRCWGNADRDPESLVETLDHYCGTESEIYVAEEQSAEIISLHHQVLRSTGLSARRFTHYVEDVFKVDPTPPGEEEHVTPWSCTVRNVRWQENVLRVAYCVRRHRKLGGLYDSVVRAVLLGDSSTALISTLSLSGVSARNSEWLSTRWLELNGWR